jgi:hypothetical protein
MTGAARLRALKGLLGGLVALGGSERRIARALRVLERELQQQSGELNLANGDPMTPGNILKLIFTGLGFTYSEDPTLAADLQPTALERLRWTLRYGEAYGDLVRAILRWCGVEARAGVAANGVTPTVKIMRPGSRFGPTPGVAKTIGGAGAHPVIAERSGARLLRSDPAVGVDALLKADPGLDRALQTASVKATVPALFPQDASRPFGWQDPSSWARFERWMRANGLLKRPPTRGPPLTDEFLPG